MADGAAAGTWKHIHKPQKERWGHNTRIGQHTKKSNRQENTECHVSTGRHRSRQLQCDRSVCVRTVNVGCSVLRTAARTQCAPWRRWSSSVWTRRPSQHGAGQGPHPLDRMLHQYQHQHQHLHQHLHLHQHQHLHSHQCWPRHGRSEHAADQWPPGT